jgi:aspartate/methionine/tyrosine aminotransferase
MSFTPAQRMSGIEKSLIRQIHERAPASAINLGLGEPDFPTPLFIRAQAIDFIEKGKIHYTPNAGRSDLRRAIAGSYDRAATEDRVCVTNGSQEALFAAIMTVVNPGDEVLLPDPGFLAYPTLVRMAGGVPVFYRLPASSNFEFDEADFRNKLSPHTRAVIVTSPSNPTGRVLRPADLQTIADALDGSSVIVIADEIYRELYFDLRPASIADFHPCTLIISGLSKSQAMTGWRLGWVYGDPLIVKSIIVFHQYATTCASSISQSAALAAFTDAGLASQEQLRRELRTRRDLLMELIDTELAPLTGNQSTSLRIIPDGAFYVMLNVSRWGTSMEVAERLLQSGVITMPGSAFGREGEGYLRVSFATEIEMLREGVMRIKQSLAPR